MRPGDPLNAAPAGERSAGQARWYRNAKRREAQALAMSEEGRKIREIAAALNVTDTTVYRIRARLRRQGRLLTPARRTRP